MSPVLRLYPRRAGKGTVLRILLNSKTTFVLDGWFVLPGDGQRSAVLKHDFQLPDWNYESRVLSEKIKINWTNELFAARRYYYRDGLWRIDQYSKITYKPDEDWLEYYMGAWVKERFDTPGFGWRDAGGLDSRNPMNLLYCGGNLVNSPSSVTVNIGRYALIETLPMNADYSQSPLKHPHHFIKQVLSGVNQEGQSTYVVDKGNIGGCGDVWVPAASPVQAALPERFLAFHPKAGSQMVHENETVTIEGYCHYGPETWAKLKGYWYKVLSMHITGGRDDLPSARNRTGFFIFPP